MPRVLYVSGWRMVKEMATENKMVVLKNDWALAAIQELAGILFKLTGKLVIVLFLYYPGDTMTRVMASSKFSIYEKGAFHI